MVLNLPVDLFLTYSVPDDLAPRLSVGHKVLVPLGNRRVSGFVTDLTSTPPTRKPRPVLRIIHPDPCFNPNLVSLILWISRYYFCSFPRAFKTALPAAVRRIKTTPQVKRIKLNVPRRTAKEAILKLSRRAPRQAEILKVLLEQNQTLEAGVLLKAASAGSGSLSSLEKKGLIEISTEVKERDSWAQEEIIPTEPLTLNQEQRQALGRIEESVNRQEFKVFLLHGVAGSGKTEIYLQAIARVLEKGRQAIVLVPEISLTPQTGERFKARFGESVAIIHSALAAGERHDQWRKIASGQARIVLGPRSAVFAPVKNLGLIVVDEEHDTSYKQAAQTPYYHARDVAVMRAKSEGAVAVLGSATPSLESYYNHRLGKYILLSLHQRPKQAILPEVKVVNMRREIETAKRLISFSPRLLERMKQTLDRGEQVILFLNRRGFHTLIMCRKCGYIARCPNCSISLTYHKAVGNLVCHLCGYVTIPPRRCPLCNSKDIFFSGLGTQRVEERIKKFFPKARIQRMDTDTVSFRDAHRQILKQFKSGKIDVLIGTQMIAKGLDYPNVTLVGVIFADTALNLADFRATEYTFQILTQVAGRAGRGELKGRIIIQTYSPRHPAIVDAARQQYEPFFEKEINFRQELGYPPFNHFINLTVLSRNEEKSIRLTEFIGKKLKPLLSGESEILGPAPPPITRIRGRYRWQLVIKTKKVVPTLTALGKVLPGLGRSRDVKIEVDVDPISML